MKLSNIQTVKLEPSKEVEMLNNHFATDDEDILNAAIDIYGHSILKYCHSILCDYHEAEDVTQDVFIKAYKKEKSLRKEHLYLLGYIGLHIRPA